MKLSIQNLAKIKKATIEFDGITVLAGLNSTSKSTIGKVLYTTINALSEVHKKIEKQRIESIVRRCEQIVFRLDVANKLSFRLFSEMRDLLRASISEWIKTSSGKGKGVTKDDLKSILVEVLRGLDIDFNDNAGDIISNESVAEIQELLNLSDNEILNVIVTRHFDDIFQGELNSRLLMRNPGADEASIVVSDQGKQTDLSFRKDACVKAQIGIPISGKAIYISDSDILDEIFSIRGTKRGALSSNYNFKYSSLAKLLKPLDNLEEQAAETAVSTSKLKEVFALIDSTIRGKFVKGKLLEEGLESSLLFSNLSSGLKMFSLLSMLVVRNALQIKDVLILDEPEVHMHPQWQVVLAHIVVLLQHYLDLTVLIITHSPYFADAISLHSQKIGNSSKVHFYYAHSNSDRSVEVDDISDNQDELYAKISTAIDILEKLRDELV